ncbi:pyridoxal phosphate-dependent aminotransferase [Companilactobacillus allii]|uniref:cysteine-S-conjugate beta-lyase n=1 Tax=Companilactobacillus allii TaxID=1847728 RepID=A0A1P8Q1T1_9LACO|nr:MalY/PatB family protein [Companilactobacillus allii]APX71786.1 plastocyanin [Companilactobacillus allii]USQ68874.1 pyridoxal phosphate-dependent aminotransferase [Companilactobacillus allii]
MSKYDFDTTIDRRKTDSVKWDIASNELPMWVADMDFKTAPVIVDAIEKKAQDAIFGYEEPHDDYFRAVADWYESEHGSRPDTDWMMFVTGVVPAISSAVRKVTSVGDNVLIQAPVYNIFYNSIVNNGRHILSNDLVYKDFDYEIDFKDLEAKLKEPLTTMMILCNPHNPVGKVWSKSDLVKIARLCNKYHVFLLSDEIHGDLTFGAEYTPMFSLDENLIQNLIVCVSPSKTFNVAAMHAATIIVPNENLRMQVNRGINTDELAEPNSFAIPVTIAAYEHGHDWLKELKEKLVDNKNIVADFLQSELPEVKLIPSQATYLLWIDTSKVSTDSKELAAFIRKETGLYLSAGNVYGGNGDDFLRLNIACPKKLLNDGLNRLKQGIELYQANLVK